MAITFHCKYCNKKIEAKDTAGGKWGNCPSCHNKIYVPNLNVDADLKLAPLDDAEVQRKKQLMRETFQLDQDILNQRELPEDNDEKPSSNWPVTDKGLPGNIIACLRALADGQIENADQYTELIAPHGDKAVAIIDKIALSDIPEPQLNDLPPQILAGLIRTLRSKIE